MAFSLIVSILAIGAVVLWYGGFFPFNKPRYAICVFLEKGGPGYYSCVLAREIIEEMINQGLI